MKVGFKTDKGRRRSNNEDACYVMLEEKVFIIADGVGGNNSGEIASRNAVNEVASYVKTHPLKKLKTPKKIKEYFDCCIVDVNKHILDMANEHEENQGMATTLVIAYIDKGKAYISNVGDSRAYIFRNGIPTQITEDHTYVNSLIKAGIISKEEAETHKDRNMITRAVGAEPIVESDFFIAPLKKDDTVLLCTDGLHGEVEDTDISDILEKDYSMTEMCRILTEKANENGGNDNITLICLKITEEDINE